MKQEKYILKLIAFFYCISLQGWGTESNTNHTYKPKINFSGALVTHQGNAFASVENITIDGKYEQIQLFRKPENVTEKTTQNGNEEIKLPEDPHNYVVHTIDLKEVDTIQSVPHQFFSYTPEGAKSDYQPKYVEVVVTLKDKKVKPYHCLVLESTHVRWDEKSSAGPIEGRINIGSLRELSIKGYKEREPEVQNTDQQEQKNAAQAKK